MRASSAAGVRFGADRPVPGGTADSGRRLGDSGDDASREKSPMVGVKDGAMSVASAATMVTAPIRVLSRFEVSVVSNQRPPKVPKNLPTVIHVAPEPSSASRSRQAIDVERDHQHQQAHWQELGRQQSQNRRDDERETHSGRPLHEACDHHTGGNQRKLSETQLPVSHFRPDSGSTRAQQVNQGKTRRTGGIVRWAWPACCLSLLEPGPSALERTGYITLAMLKQRNRSGEVGLRRLCPPAGRAGTAASAPARRAVKRCVAKGRWSN